MNNIIAIALVLLLLVDWAQTVQIAKHPERWYERNPLLGKHPSVRRVHLWFAACVAAAVAVAVVAPAVAALFVLVEVLCVVNNYLLGIRP